MVTVGPSRLSADALPSSNASVWNLLPDSRYQKDPQVDFTYLGCPGSHPNKVPSENDFPGAGKTLFKLLKRQLLSTAKLPFTTPH